MIKRLLLILAVLAIAAPFFTSSALAGPPFPAEVIQIREGEFCYFPWLDDLGNGVTLTGTGIWVAQYKNGQIQWNCHTKLDFSDPNIASTEEVCYVTDVVYEFDICKGKDLFLWKQSYEPFPNGCADIVDGVWYYSDDSQTEVTSKGIVNISCHYDILP